MISEAGARIKIHTLRQESVDPFLQNMQIYFIYLFIHEQTRQIQIRSVCLCAASLGSKLESSRPKLKHVLLFQQKEVVNHTH